MLGKNQVIPNKKILEELELLFEKHKGDYFIRKRIRRLFLKYKLTSSCVRSVIKIKSIDGNSYIHDELLSYYKTYHQRRGRKKSTVIKNSIENAIEGAGHTKAEFDSKKMISRIILHDNRLTGKMYEKSFAEIIMGRILSDSQNIPNIEIIHDKKVFDINNDNISGKRRIDLFFPQLEFAVEVKSGRLIMTKNVKRQMKLDSCLIKNKSISGCLWFLMHGASSRVLDHLDDLGIEFWDLGWSYS